jgi:hypothetical protein
MFVKLTKPFVTPIFTTVEGLESFAGLDGKGVHHKKAWTPDVENIYGVIPQRYWGDFQFTLMTINSILLPHRDNDLISTINFYIKTDNCRTVFYKEKENATFWQPEVQISGTEVPLEQQIGYVKAVYQLEDVEETGSFVAQPNEAWLLDVREIHNVEPMGDFSLRKALTLRTTKYEYNQVCEMLKETGNL